MPVEIRMPALSPTMESGKLSRWLVKEGDSVASGDLLAEIETDKATIEFEAVDEGTIISLVVPEGAEGVKVGAVIAMLGGESEAAEKVPAPVADAPAPTAERQVDEKPAEPVAAARPASAPAGAKPAGKGERIVASPLARRLAAERSIDLASIAGSGPNGRIVVADLDKATPSPAGQPPLAPASAPVTASEVARIMIDERVPHTVEPLSGMRKTIARRLTQSMQQAPHIYLTVDIRLDRLLAMRSEMNAALERQGIKLSVNDMLVKALGKALIDVPECNVTFAGDELIRYARADISVAVSIPGGLITPIVQDANGRSLSSIAGAMNDLAERARSGKLQPAEYEGGTASISNMGMMGIRQFTAVINPPQSTILAIGAGEKRPWVMPDGTLGVATVMSATGSFDHRAIDGADGARLMGAFREYVENPLTLAA